MSAVRVYLLRLTACAFLVALLSVLVTHPRMHRLVKLCGGCLIVIAAIGPLLLLDWSAVPAQVFDTDLSTQTRLEEAREKNDQLLADMIRQRTEREILAACRERELSLTVSLELRFNEEIGLPVPWSIQLSGAVNAAEKGDFSAYLQEVYGIPPERQVWTSE